MQTIIYFVFLLKCSMCSFFSPLTFIHRDHFYQIFEKISSSPVHPLGSAPYLPLTDHLEDRLFVFYGFCNVGVVSFSRSLSTFISRTGTHTCTLSLARTHAHTVYIYITRTHTHTQFSPSHTQKGRWRDDLVDM